MRCTVLGAENYKEKDSFKKMLFNCDMTGDCELLK